MNASINCRTCRLSAVSNFSICCKRRCIRVSVALARRLAVSTPRSASTGTSNALANTAVKGVSFVYLSRLTRCLDVPAFNWLAYRNTWCNAASIASPAFLLRRTITVISAGWKKPLPIGAVQQCMPMCPYLIHLLPSKSHVDFLSHLEDEISGEARACRSVV